MMMVELLLSLCFVVIEDVLIFGTNIKEDGMRAIPVEKEAFQRHPILYSIRFLQTL